MDISKEDLINKIKEINSITNEKWLDGLEDRKKKELEFHNKDRDPSFVCLLYTSPSPRDTNPSRMPSSA